MVVIGGGAGALAAAVSAMDAGLDQVVVLDPGNAADLAADSVAPAVFAAAGTDLQRGAGIDDTPDEFAEWWMALARGNADQDLVDFIARESAATVSWLESIGVPFVEPGGAFLPASGPFIAGERAHVVDGGYAELHGVLYQAAIERGVDIRTHEPVTSLLSDKQGRVVGVRVGLDGREHRLLAREAVVLTDGVGAVTDSAIAVDSLLDPTEVQLGGADRSTDSIALAESAGAAVSERTGVTAGYSDGRYRQARIGGLDVTETSHVMRSDGSTIPRLYATGRIAGNRYFYRVRLSPQASTLMLTQARTLGEHVGRYRRGG